MRKTFKYRLSPSTEQKKQIDTTIETCRLLYNRELEWKIQAYEGSKTLIQRKELQQYVKNQRIVNPYMQKVYIQILHDVGARMIKSYDNFFRRVKSGNEKPGYPKFKGRRNYNSFCYTQSGFKLAETILDLSKIGKVKVNLHRPLEGKIKTCTILRSNGRYYVCFSCEVEEQPLERTGKNIGIDVGITNFVITSDGEFFSKLDPYHKAEKHLKYLQRMVSRRKKGSHRRRKAVRLLAKHYEKIGNQRKDLVHKASTKLIQQYDLIAHENLQVKNMVQNHHLAKSIHDAAGTCYFKCWRTKRVTLVAR